MTPRSRAVTALRAPGFSCREGGLLRHSGVVLYAEDIPLPKLAGKYGTPLYVDSRGIIDERYREFDRTFRNIPHTVCYSVKANSNLSILRLLARKGSGFDIVSGGELERVLAADRKAAKQIG